MKRTPLTRSSFLQVAVLGAVVPNLGGNSYDFLRMNLLGRTFVLSTKTVNVLCRKGQLALSSPVWRQRRNGYFHGVRSHSCLNGAKDADESF